MIHVQVRWRFASLRRPSHHQNKWQKPHDVADELSTADSYFNNILHIFPLFNNSFQSVTNLLGTSIANVIICALRGVHFKLVMIFFFLNFFFLLQFCIFAIYLTSYQQQNANGNELMLFFGGSSMTFRCQNQPNIFVFLHGAATQQFSRNKCSEIQLVFQNEFWHDAFAGGNTITLKNLRDTLV